MRLTQPNINYLWSTLMVEELVRQGADYFCLAPGSRCSPLTVAVAQNKKAKSYIHFDERGLAFHALGYVSATKKPAVLICTSGTAGANFLPAVIEASKKKLPLIVLTADRPPELRHTGAMQTIDQVGLFGEYVRWQFDMPVPDPAIQASFVLTTIGQAMHRAQGELAGPVHINCMYREPLAPTKDKVNISQYSQSVSSWAKQKQPFTSYVKDLEAGQLTQAEDIAKRLNGIKKGIIVVGKIGSQVDGLSIRSLAQTLGWPVFADVTSGLRLGDQSEEVVHYFDQLLLSSKWKRKLNIDGVLHLGGRITSKRWYQFVESKSLKEYVMVLNHPLRNDPLHNVTLRVQAKVDHFCDSVMPLLKERSTQSGSLDGVDKVIDRSLDSLSKEKKLSEGSVARLISQHIGWGQGLFLANSMPVRAMDMYADPKGSAVTVSGNRGASGIDGLVATSVGFAKGLGKPVTSFLGDLALLHDLNSLSMAGSVSTPLVFVVVNNDGGGIFSFLPIAEYKEVFDKYFGTPHGFTFAQAAKMFGVTYAQPTSADSFVKAYKAGLKRKGVTLIEVITKRKENVATHQRWQNKIIKAIEK